MSLLQKAVETYDCHEKYIGKPTENGTVLAPISHIITRAQLEIIIDMAGNFCAASEVDPLEPKIVIPATERSAGRTSGACAYPLCDQLCYLASYNSEKHSLYLEQLDQWITSPYTHPKLQPIMTYVQGGTILSDLVQCDLIELNDKGIPKDEKMLVRWRVLGSDTDDACWRDETLFESFIQFYQSMHQDDEQGLCAISGEVTRIADQHPKGIVPICGNAKLISSNDNSGFTYRGRFTDEKQAVTIGYEASQKAHHALHWLVENQGARAVFGGRTFLCWNPQGRKVCHVTGPLRNMAPKITEPTEYQDELKKVLRGYQNELPETEGVVIAAFDAATSGRLALTYYREIQSSDFLHRLYEWDRVCCWYAGSYGIQSPSLRNIVNGAFGTPQGDKKNMKFQTDKKVMKQQIQRLICCRIDGAPMPMDIVKGLLYRVSRLQNYPDNIQENLLTTSCAVIRKYRYDRLKEEWAMTLEEERKDRSYQFGRLLAAMEQVERATYDKKETREPNAMRQQSVFCQRPLYAASNIEKQLERAYFPKLKPGLRQYYKKTIAQIMEMIHTFPRDQWNRPLSETYIMGYYLQRNAFYTKKNDDVEEENHE